MSLVRIRDVVAAAVLCVVAFAPVPAPAAERADPTYRPWTSAKGDTVNAVFAREADGYVHLRKADGRSVRIKRQDLSADDQTYLDGLRGAAGLESGTAAAAIQRPQAATDFLPEEPGGPELASQDGAMWWIGKAVVSSNFDWQAISNTYTQRFDTFYCHRTVPAGYRLIVVKCVIKALTNDVKAIDSLNALRTPLAGKLPLVGKNMLVSDEERKVLAGQYRLVDSTGITLFSDTQKKRFTAMWLVLPAAKAGAYFLETGDQPLFGGLASNPPWHRTLAVKNGFTGLLEVGRPASVALFFGIPVDLDPLSLCLSIEGQGNVMLATQ